MGNDVAQLVSDCQDDKPEGSSISATVFNYVNSVIGSGIIGMHAHGREVSPRVISVNFYTAEYLFQEWRTP